MGIRSGKDTTNMQILIPSLKHLRLTSGLGENLEESYMETCESPSTGFNQCYHHHANAKFDIKKAAPLDFMPFYFKTYKKCKSINANLQHVRNGIRQKTILASILLHEGQNSELIRMPHPLS